MQKYIHIAIVTSEGLASNNHGENDGNLSAMQKILWGEEVYTTVSAEAIRWALRHQLQLDGQTVNRRWDSDKNDYEYSNGLTKGAPNYDAQKFVDDDVFGFMHADSEKNGGNGTKKRKGALDVSRAISTTPFVGDITFGAKAGEKGRTSLHSQEVHYTAYQFGATLNLTDAKDMDRALHVVQGFDRLNRVGGNHSRFQFDFSPASILLWVTSNPANKLLNSFDSPDTASKFLKRLNQGRFNPKELFVGGDITDNEAALEILVDANVSITGDPAKAIEEACDAALEA